MSDPTLVTQIVTTGTASVSVIGADGSGKSKVLTAAEVRTAAETISETAINTALSGKQATLVSGTNIKTVNSTSLLGSGDIVISSGTLTTVTITDAAVAMVANRRYQGSIAAFTADRNYTLPAGTAGDVIEVQITTGDDLYELILLGATGVSINGGSAATEWSRLFISSEFVRFRCHATNDWWVEIDGRISEYCEIYGTSTTALVLQAFTLPTMAGANNPHGMAATNQIVHRRSGIFTAAGSMRFSPSGGTERGLYPAIVTAGVSIWPGSPSMPGGKAVTSLASEVCLFSWSYEITQAEVGKAIAVWYYVDGSNGNQETGNHSRPSLQVRRSK